jgi:hypothetical protein
MNLQRLKTQKGVIASRLIGSITAPSALFTNAFATFSLPKEMQEASLWSQHYNPNDACDRYDFKLCCSNIGVSAFNRFFSHTNGKHQFKSHFETSTKSIVQFNYNEGYRSNLAKTLDNLSYRVLG